MNVGDLVTLSARGRKLEVCWKWRCPTYSRGLVGLVLCVDEPRYCGDHEKKYTVKWTGDGPPGRQRYWGPHWHRSDLKFVAKAKK